MKNKPIRHKNKNVHKFQSFSERISNIDIDIFHRISHPNETNLDDNELESNFYQTIQKWNTLNLTENYNAFRKEVYDVITLPQLLHKKEYVVSVLLKHLELKNPLALQPLLELVVSLTKDLRKEFYPYYPKFLVQLISLLGTKETDQLEWTFTCLAYLFKFLWREFIKDIDDVFVNLLPLLSDTKPQYINNFAVESFSFVARKVKDRTSFLALILTTVQTRKDNISSCGKLLFEVIKGVNGNFHSCAESTLSFYFESLCNEKFPQDLLFEILEKLIDNLAENVHPKNINIFWKCLTEIIDKCITKQNTKETGLFLKLTVRMLEYRNGRMSSVEHLVKLYQKLIILELPENVMLILIQIGALLLTSKNVQLSQEYASVLIRKTLVIEQQQVILSFIEQLTNYTSFEALVLPTFLKQFSFSLDSCSFRVLTKLLVKKTQNNWKKYPLEFSTQTENVIEFLCKFLTLTNVDEIELDHYLCALIILPHINSINHSTVFNLLKTNVQMIYDELNVEKSKEENQKLLFLFLNLIDCVVHIIKPEMIFDLYKNLNCLDTIFELVQMSEYTVCCLRILDRFVTSCNRTDLISFENLRRFDSKLLTFFSSPYHQVRLLTAHIYLQFEHLKELNKTNSETWKVFTLIHNTESIESLVHTYRDQLQYLQQLSYDKPQAILCQQTEFNTIPLRYLLGCLYMNFQLLWEPIINLIVTYANGMTVQVFWDVFSTELKAVVKNVTKEKNKDDVNDVNCNKIQHEFLNAIFMDTFRIDNKPDFGNYRILLWKAMAEFPHLVEMRGKDVVPLMLNFIEDEYRKSNPNDALIWNIKRTSSANNEMENVDSEDEDENDNENENESENENVNDKDIQIKKKLNRSINITSGKSNLKNLLIHLQVFTKFKNPKSTYRESDLYKLYLELLTHRNSEVQKLALDCLMVYKFKYITPYRENLYGLIDDKQFRNELTFFRIDKETTSIQDEDRSNLIPIVLRIVYSKMMAKTGMRTGGKSSGQFRRYLVLRFLAGCHQHEVMEFVHMAFKYYSVYLDLEPSIIIQNVDLEKFVSPKRLQSTLNLLNIMLEQFGGLMGNELLNYLLKILFIIGSLVLAAYKDKNLIQRGCASTLRTIKSNCQMILSRFFGRFDSFPWTSKQLELIFDTFVWPWLDKLTTEGVYSPTSLLKLCHQWGSNPRYFPLLVKEKDNKFILNTLIELLLIKTQPSVTNTILEILEQLLSLKSDEDEDKLEVEGIKPIATNILERLSLNEINYGSCVLLPFVPKILEKFQKKLENKNKMINPRELFILSRISELVWEPSTCDTVLILIIPLVVKRVLGTASDETVLQYLTTVYNLIKKVIEPKKHIRQLSPLFGDLKSTPARKLLIDLFNYIATKHEDLNEMCSILNDLNAFDKKWLEQPDFDRRHNAYKSVNEMMKEESINFEFGSILIYHCFYAIRNETDLALRECAHLCLHTLVPYLIQKNFNNELLINNLIFPILRTGFKSKNDHFRNESIKILGLMSRNCPNAHFVLRDLNIFTNKTDLEVDLFENLLHLQIHRQMKALHRFCQICSELTVTLSPKTLTQYVLPLISSFLLSDKYKDKSHVTDAAIETVKTICLLLPWHHYEAILKFYLSQLRYKMNNYQKQIVRLVVSILDAYHFDLTKAQGDNEVKTSVPETTEQTEDLDEVLDGIKENLLEEEPSEMVPNTFVINKISVLCPSAARRVLFSIKTVLIPQLNKSMAELTQHDESHKVNRRRRGFEREEAELQKVPLALAVVKLLQKISTDVLEQNLPGVFIKLCTFLKSPLDSVRRLARETLQKIMLTLGPNYLSSLISEMSSLLTKGFQVHVLVYTIHSILVTLKDTFKPTDVDKCLINILEFCKMDIFGNVADEKEVVKITAKVSEAKTTKSYDTYQILAQYITETCLMDLLLPLKNILQTSHSYKQISKVQECLRRIVLGLVDNTFIPIESLLIFSYGTSTESIPDFVASTATSNQRRNKSAENPQTKPDCFIIPKAPVYKSGYRVNLVRNSSKAHAHLLVEFGLRLCYFVLKRERIKHIDYSAYVDPFVEVFKNCLSSRHVKMCTLTIQCLTWVMKYELPSMKTHINDITIILFEFLHKYGSSGLSKGDNFDLVVATFKAMAVLVRDVSYYVIDTDQLKALLLYVEQDLHDFERQATAFSLLKAIIARKLIIPEIHDVIYKVAELSITSELTHVRAQCRQIFHQFLMDYPLGNKLDKHLSFYLSQIKYEMQPGRESALEMIQGLIVSFPIDVLKEQAGMFFVLLGARLVNDDAPNCRKMVAKSIQSLLERLDKSDRNVLFNIVKEWFNDKKVIHRRLAAQLSGLFITVEKSKFNSRIPVLIPLIKTQLKGDNTPGAFVRVQQQIDDSNQDKSQPEDHLLFQLLQMLLKLCSICPLFLDRIEDIEEISEYVQVLLAHPHEWVRIAAAQFIGYVLAGLKTEHLANLLLNQQSDQSGYLYKDPNNNVKSLTLDLCAQLQPGVKAELIQQVIKNLVFIARVLQHIPIDHENCDLNLLWLIKRMRKIVNREIVETPKSTVLRSEVFKWIAGVATVTNDLTSVLLHHLLAPLIRELATTNELNESLRQMAKEVTELLKTKVDSDLYISTVSQLQMHLNAKRAERKMERKQLAITEPELAAKKKLRVQERKKLMKKKRKLEDVMGDKKVVKKKRKEMNTVDVDDF